MEQEEILRIQHQDKEKEIQQQIVIPSMNEPEFIYEKGIPRKNPKYKTPAEIEAMKEAQAQAQALHNPKSIGSRQIHMTPFVSMISDNGVIPPPIVNGIKHSLETCSIISKLVSLPSFVALISKNISSSTC